MGEVLGTGHNEAVIYERGGGRELFRVPAVTSLEWGRVLDGISRATLTCTPATATEAGLAWAGSQCAGLLSTIQPWAHEVVIYRDDERVWEGPVLRPSQTRGGVKIAAADVLAWGDRTVAPAVAGTGLSVRAVALDALTGVFDTVDRAPLNVIDNVQTLIGPLPDLGAVTDLDVKGGAYYSSLLGNLVNAGLYYTVVGRRIVIWDDSRVVVGLTGDLDTARHVIGDVETAREGDLLATRAYALNDDGEVGTDGGVDDFYGLVERAVSAPGVTGPTALSDAAARWRKYRYPAPETLTLPAGATLNCDAPFPIGILVPGVLTPVSVLDLCWPVEQTMMLTEVKVTQDAGGEKVAVTYTPLTGDETT